ncbi:hypothetical protein GTH52_04070 [Clostridium tyrobutyricum]|jgi:DNA repair ATPase RecN|uniref:Uncharacterized protein n=1 Tax=Clostridium tyrobutyricum DIVETGP TaxID=1408889 RepID=W6N305_CLOTY|nr:hypothetical protein [Clostridium tyrobutyricum]AND84963.1 hypothetical protein CTK_C17080 [Clostridium tyrobutyricum]ANP69529.1 hypothetical protein BA182_07560 [Clostridium tyrobutyricum]MBR9648508.1 hypothetical protein [Clostridium tyrobutyricum]MBV4414791.1 hypothetical protein [Clostridium tyrobutyricum]MBV4422407.1 hypothetical protein [Clostridium tyrobutyricum]
MNNKSINIEDYLIKKLENKINEAKAISSDWRKNEDMLNDLCNATSKITKTLENIYLNDSNRMELHNKINELTEKSLKAQEKLIRATIH